MQVKLRGSEMPSGGVTCVGICGTTALVREPAVQAGSLQEGGTEKQ